MTLAGDTATDAHRHGADAKGPNGRGKARGHAALQRDLERVAADVRFDAGARALYATDASIYREVPIGVVVPHSIEEVVSAVEVCHYHGAPLLCRGGGTSLAGQCCNTAVVIDFSKHLNRILHIDAEKRTARVQPGVVLDHLREAAQAHNLTFAPDPSTHNHNTLGGMIGNNSCGAHSVMGGRTSDNVIALDVLTYDGKRLGVGRTNAATVQRIIGEGGWRGAIYERLLRLRDRYAELIRERYPDIPRRVSGYNLDELLPERDFHVARALVGSEGTCVTVLEAEVRLVPSPPERALLILGFDDVFAAADAVPRLMELGPVAVEGIDQGLVDDQRRNKLNLHTLDQLPEGSGWLIAEFGGDDLEEARDRAQRARDAFGNRAGCVFDGRPAHAVWKVREAGLGATAHVHDGPDTHPGWEDAAVPPERLGEYLRHFAKLLEQHRYKGDLYGHFGQGCVHVRINFDLAHEDGRRAYRRFIEEAADLVVSFGGSLSGEHGDGQARGALLSKMYGPELVQAFREFKRIWDPDGLMNPGKVVDADDPARHLRLAKPSETPKTRFAYPADHGDFSWAVRRCVGVGECRKTTQGTMCPSYMATREERHSTRGRARLLHEMLVGDVIADGWRSTEVKDALELCLACKACRHECPVKVDMATYKAEFMSHHYRGRLRPRAAYAFGHIDRWARLGSLMPGMANRVTQNRSLGRVLKSVAGVAQERSLPSLPHATFMRWFRSREARREGRPVLLWPDTFNNYFTPHVAQAATLALERLGFRVAVGPTICCGRPLYAFGMLDRARDLLRQIMTSLSHPPYEGMPIIALEPACGSVFRDELVQLWPKDRRARDISERVVLFGDFVHRANLELPPLARRALVHIHCNQGAVFSTDDTTHVLTDLGVEHRLLDSGCCGMAGSFGFEADKYEVSTKLAERVLLPAIRASDEETLIVADGYSCREQIRQLGERRAVHCAEVVALALGHSMEDPWTARAS